MGFIDKLLNKVSVDEEDDNLSTVVSDKATKLIRELSGGEKEYLKKSIDNVILFTSSSGGGTGVSTIVTNVAYTMSRKKHKVVVLDLNVLYPMQHNYFGVDVKLERPDLVGYLTGNNTIAEAIVNTGIADLIFANNREALDCVKCETDSCVNALKEMIKRLRELYDFVLIDCPMDVLSKICNTAMFMCDSIYTVWDEGLASIANIEKVRRNLALTGIDSYTKMSVILNKRTDVKYSKYPMEKLGIELIGVLPYSTDVVESSLSAKIYCRNGVATNNNGKEFAKAIIALTDKILNRGGCV